MSASTTIFVIAILIILYLAWSTQQHRDHR